MAPESLEEADFPGGFVRSPLDSKSLYTAKLWARTTSESPFVWWLAGAHMPCSLACPAVRRLVSANRTQSGTSATRTDSEIRMSGYSRTRLHVPSQEANATR